MVFDLNDFVTQYDRNEDWLARHVVSEVRRGGRLVDVLQDPAVLRRCDAMSRARVVDRPEVVQALSEIAVASLRDQIASGRPAPDR